MLLKADKNGFLIGYSLQGDRAEELLTAIRGDTSKMLALMRKGGSVPSLPTVSAPRVRSSGAPRMFDMGPSSPGPREMASSIAREVLSSGKTSTPATRAALTNAVRRAANSEKREARVEKMAAQTQTLAREAVTLRRQEINKAKQEAAASQLRDARGKFSSHGKPTADTDDGEDDGPATPSAGHGGKSGKKPGAGHGGGESGGHGGAGQTLEEFREVDPLIGSANEGRVLSGSLKQAVAPVGRAGAGILGALRRLPAAAPTKDAKEQTKLLRRMAQWGEKQKAQGVMEAGGFTSQLTNQVLGIGQIASNLVNTAAVFAGGAATAGLRFIAKKIPAIAGILGVVGAWHSLNSIQGDDSLSEKDKNLQSGEIVGALAGAIGGTEFGAAFGGALAGPLGVVIGGVLGGVLGALGGKGLGNAVVRLATTNGGEDFESNGDPGAISSGNGDPGGKSYGISQMSSNKGVVQKFLASSGYGSQFAGMAPGSPAFDAQWKALAASDPNFKEAQTDFIDKTHTGPQMAKLAAAGLDLSGRSAAINGLVRSTATQFGPDTDVITKALAGSNVSAMSDADIISKVQDFKTANNASLFRSSSPAVQASVLNRSFAEKAMYLSMAGSPNAPSIGTTPSPPVLTAPGAAPQIDFSPSSRVNSGPMERSAPAPSPAAGQDVKDRGIAHIVTGGIGAPTFQR